MDFSFLHSLKEEIIGTSIDSIFILGKNEYLIDIYKNQRFHVYLNLNKKIISTIPLTPEERKTKLKKFKFEFRKITSPIIKDVLFCENCETLKIKIHDERNLKWEYPIYFIFVDFFNKNILLTEENEKVLKAIDYSKISSLKCLYEDFKSKINFDYQSYQENAKKCFLISLEKASHSPYNSYLKTLKSKEKNLLKKIEINEKNIIENKTFEIYKDFANYLLTFPEEINLKKCKNNEVSFEGKNFKIDPTKSFIENANIYFKKYKKLKSGLLNSTKILNVFIEELKEVRTKISQISELDIKQHPILSKIKQDKSKNNTHVPYSKFSFINTNFYLGKSKKDNDQLTFKSGFNKDICTFMHLQNISSAHLIADKNIENDSKALEIGASLILKDKGFKDGDVIYTTLKNVFKTNDPGKVIVKNFKTIHIKNICDEVKNLK